MKKTPKQIMNAYRAIQELTLCVLPYKTARAVNRLKKGIQTEFETVLNTEQNMVSKYGGHVVDGTYKFPDGESAEKFHKEYTEWLSQEDDVSLPTADVSRCVDAIKISSAGMDALEGLVDFGED